LGWEYSCEICHLLAIFLSPSGKTWGEEEVAALFTPSLSLLTSRVLSIVIGSSIAERSLGILCLVFLTSVERGVRSLSSSGAMKEACGYQAKGKNISL